MSASNYVHIDVEEIKMDTNKAFLLSLTDTHNGIEIWMPKSHIVDADDYKVGDKNCTISVSEYIYTAKGLRMKKGA